jgi:agmatine deiminase
LSEGGGEGRRFSLPPEWAPHRACWLAWPWRKDLWGAVLPEVQAGFLALCEVIARSAEGPSSRPPEALEILVSEEAQIASLQRGLDARGLVARLHRLPFGDLWMRDIGPIMGWGREGRLAAQCFAFNGWGGRYVMAGDAEVAVAVAERAEAAVTTWDAVVEGGAVDVDGEGTCLTTRACLLHENRHPMATEATMTAVLQSALGVSKVIWLDEGLLGDHTDGHVDNLARFVAPGRVVAMTPSGPEDPNRSRLTAVRRVLEHARDASGRELEVVTMPSPGAVYGPDGHLLPASYLNFYVANHAVAVPCFGVASDGAAMATIRRLFPDRHVVGIPCNTLLTGGGALHCITCPEPWLPTKETL